MNLRFGNLLIGDVPRVVGTIITPRALADFPRMHLRDCDLAEVRLDLIGEDADWMAGARQIEAAGTPVLLTLRTVAEGGKCQLDAAALRSKFDESWSAVSAIDLEHQRPESVEIAHLAHQRKKPVVVSFHDFNKTPPGERLAEIARAAAAYADVVKISTMVNSNEDLAVLESLLHIAPGRPICVIGMGPLGATTRTDYPLAGSCLTYGYLDSAAAPGQISARDLVQLLRQRSTEYAGEFERRHRESLPAGAKRA